jgi:hypothetical protein
MGCQVSFQSACDLPVTIGADGHAALSVVTPT